MMLAQPIQQARALFDADTVPAGVQFVVSRKRVRANSKAFYVHCRDWLMRQQSLTELDAAKFFEFAWHIIFRESACDNNG